ncbi:MAG: hypothetical protein SGBAC_010848, partial [Bacillariaceae sp.]
PFSMKKHDSEKKFRLPNIVGWCWIGLFSAYVVQSVNDDSREENDATSKVRQLVLRQRVDGTEYNLLTNHPQHAFFAERRLAQASSNTRSESSSGEDQLHSKGSTYDPKKVHASAASAAFVGMQLNVYRRGQARHRRNSEQDKNLGLSSASEGGDSQKPQHLSDGTSVVTESECHEVEARAIADIDQPDDEDDQLYYDSFIYEKAYHLTEPLTLELGVPPRHNLDYAYKPVIPQDNPFTQQPDRDEKEKDTDSPPDTPSGDEYKKDPENLSCTEVSPMENVFSNWWKWWLPWSHNEWWKNYGSKRSDYKMGSSAFAGGSHGEVWRGRRICPKGSSADCDDQQPLIFKRLRVEKGYRLLEAGLREIYMGNWIRHDLLEAQQSLYTAYVDHFFREILVDRSFGLYQSTRLELWIVFEEAGPSLRSYIYDTVTIQGGGFVMYQPSRLWSSLRSFRGKSDRQGSSLSLNLRDGNGSQGSTEQSKGQLASRGNGGGILRTVLQHVLSSAALLHENGYVHRDIKPSNVMCSTDTSPSYDWNGVPQLSNIECRLGDFSSAWDENYIAANLYTKGPSPAEQTDEYAPPESYISDEWVPFDRDRPQSYDSWSIGVLALELLLGTPNVFTVDQRTTALLTHKMKKENASEEEIQQALYLAALSHFCIYMPGNTGNNNPTILLMSLSAPNVDAPSPTGALAMLITKPLSNIWKEAIRANVSDAFAQIHEEFVERTSRTSDASGDRSGTTATSFLVTEDVVVVASIGDSRAVLSSMNKSGEMAAIPLTKDHVASDPDERILVIEKGGFVSSSGGIDRVNGTLAITRSIGDAGLAPLLSRVPHVVSFTHDEIRYLCGANQQQSMPCFVVLASDGLWDVISNQDAVDMVAAVVASYDTTDRVSWNNGGAFQEAAEVLAVDAYVRGSNDNIGVMRDVEVAEENQSKTKRYACFAAVVVALFFVLSLSGGDQDAGAEVVGGQAKHHIVTHSKTDTGTVGTVDPGLDEDAEFSDARAKFERTVKEQVSMNENMLSEEMGKELEKIEVSLEKLLSESGVDFSEDEITTMKEGIRSKLDDDVHKFIDDQVDETLEKEKTEFQNDLDIDADDTKAEGEKEAEAQKSEILVVLRDKVDEICISAKSQMKSFAAVAEKKILEEKFEEKTSESYVANISDENTVISVEKGSAAPKGTKKGTKKAPTPSPTEAPKNFKKGTKKAPELEQDEEDKDDEEDEDDEDEDDEDDEDE